MSIRQRRAGNRAAAQTRRAPSDMMTAKTARVMTSFGAYAHGTNADSTPVSAMKSLDAHVSASPRPALLAASWDCVTSV
jgi:hypothetical protein